MNILKIICLSGEIKIHVTVSQVTVDKVKLKSKKNNWSKT